MVHDLLVDLFRLITILTLLPLCAVAFAAGVAAFIQAALQLQDQAMVHFVRLLAFIGVVACAGSRAYQVLEEYLIDVIRMSANTLL